jgi:hypothetical protein
VPIDQNNAPALRDYIAARGGTISGMNKSDLVKKASLNHFLEEHTSRHYVDRYADRNGSTYISVDTSSTIPIGTILADANRKFATVNDLPDVKALISETNCLFQAGEFETGYENIARIAPELSQDFIYKTFAHIGSSIEQKNIGDALKRCLESKQDAYHGIAIEPETKRCIILCKAVASMNRDEKTRKHTDDGEPPEKMEYMLIMELFFEPTTHIANKHDLGVFTRFGRSYCTACVAGQGYCRHRPERLWRQFHYWTDERFGIERPTTLDAIPWGPNAKVLVSELREPIYKQQCVVFEKSLEAQEAKQLRGVKRNCTEGNPANYTVYMSAEKQQPNPNRFTRQRMQKLCSLITKRDNGKETDFGRPCRAAVRLFGATDVGLDDVRGDVSLWGLNEEVTKFQQLSAMEEHKNKSPQEIGEMVLSMNMPYVFRKELYQKYHGREYDGAF